MKADLPDTKVVFKVGWQDGRQDRQGKKSNMKADLPDTKVVFKVGWQDGRQDRQGKKVI